MTTDTYQIRLCLSCGLRYPLDFKQYSKNRCPACRSNTQLLAEHTLQAESWLPAAIPSFHFEVILDNIRSAETVGLIFCAAREFGGKHLYLCGLTPTPRLEAVRGVSKESEKSISWTYHKDSVLTLRALKEQGCKAFALGHATGAISIKEIALARRRRASDTKKKPINEKASMPPLKHRWIGAGEKIVFVVGNGKTGVDPDLIHLCDDVVFIPTLGEKDSLHEALAFTVAISQIAL